MRFCIALILGTGLLAGFHGGAQANSSDDREIQRQIRDDISQLSAPAAIERAEALIALADKERTPARLLHPIMKSEFAESVKEGHLMSRVGLLEVAEARREPNLTAQAVESFKGKDETLMYAARAYLMVLPYQDVAGLDAQEFLAYRLRYKIAYRVLELSLGRARYDGQFDELLKSEPSPQFESEMLAFLERDEVFVEPMRDALDELIELRERTISADQIYTMIKMRNLAAYLDQAFGLNLRSPDAKSEHTAAKNTLIKIRELVARFFVNTKTPDTTRAQLLEFLDKSTDKDLYELKKEVKITLYRLGEKGPLSEDHLEPMAEKLAKLETDKELKGTIFHFEHQVDYALLLLVAREFELAETAFETAIKANTLGRRETNSEGEAKAFDNRLANLYYNRACLYSLQGLVTKSLADLKRLQSLGIEDFDIVFEDQDLEAVRSTNEFRVWVEKSLPPRYLENIRRAD